MRLVLQSVFIPREGQLIILTGTAVLNGHVQPDMAMLGVVEINIFDVVLAHGSASLHNLEHCNMVCFLFLFSSHSLALAYF